jgi:hypothetical protein
MSNRTMRFRIGLFFDRYSEQLHVDPIVGRLTPEPTPVNLPFEPTDIAGEVPDIRFLVGTSHAGLLLFQGPRATQLFRGSDFFGISRRGDRWYAFQRYLSNGRIISFRLDHGRASDARTEVAGLSRGVHQIDFIDDSLWVVDTYHDRLLEIPVEALGRGWRRRVRQHHPIGRRGLGRERPRHAHFNSIYRCGGGILLVAHNDTVKSRRGSELFVLDSSGSVVARTPMGGSCCHNVGIIAGKMVTCRSLEGCVAVDGHEVLAGEGFLRGLALGPDFHVIGRSACEGDRLVRHLGDGGLIITSTDFTRVASIRLTGTAVHEVRRVDIEDLCLSMTPRPDLDGLTTSDITAAAGARPAAAGARPTPPHEPVPERERVPAQAR